jgi:hypothetical protein
MEKIASLVEAENKVLSNIRKYLTDIRGLVQDNPSSVLQGIDTLKTLRKTVYEDINQIQHEEMILRAVRFLQASDFQGRTVEWYWNPRQTGDLSEPDLTGLINGEVAVSIEVTASENPVGNIDSRMASTLKKLNDMPGRKYYFVRTPTMKQRAMTKVAKNKYSVAVRRI